MKWEPTEEELQDAHRIAIIRKECGENYHEAFRDELRIMRNDRATNQNRNAENAH